jgi:hypothetical protein
MERPNLAEKIKAAGYGLKLTDDWKQVKVSGDSRLPEPLRSQLKADKEQVRFWLMAETLARHLEGKIVIETDVPPIFWAKYPSGTNGSATAFAHKNRLLDSWLGSAEAILAQRDEKKRLDATRSEIDTCIAGLRGFPQPEAVAMVERLEDSLPEAKKCSARLSAAVRRKQKKKSEEEK